MIYNVGSELDIKGHSGKVIGYIEYYNPNDGYKTWIDYRMRGREGEFWLSVDDYYQEYSLSWPANDVRGSIGPEWHKVDEGTQIVKSYAGAVDVDPGERADFVEYEDATEEKTLSVEIWSDGTEYSRGEYVEKEEISVVYLATATSNFSSGSFSSGSKTPSAVTIVAVAAVFLTFIPGILGGILGGIGGSSKIANYLKNSSLFKYETSITGNEKQTATVYSYKSAAKTDDVAKAIINGISGDTESVTQRDDKEDEEIAILTKKEYCLIYHPEDDKNTVLVQISNRKYNYTSDKEPYRSSKSVSGWYRKHYYSSGYKHDMSSYGKSSSAYSMYSGDTIHNIGNGYFDTYSKSVKQSSVSSRNSSSGGISSGK